MDECLLSGLCPSSLRNGWTFLREASSNDKLRCKDIFEGKDRVCVRSSGSYSELFLVTLAWSDWEHFYSPLPDGMPLPSRVTPDLDSLVPIQSPGWREALREWSVLCPRTKHSFPPPGLQPGLLDPVFGALTIWQLRLVRKKSYFVK